MKTDCFVRRNSLRISASKARHYYNLCNTCTPQIQPYAVLFGSRLSRIRDNILIINFCAGKFSANLTDLINLGLFYNDCKLQSLFLKVYTCPG